MNLNPITCFRLLETLTQVEQERCNTMEDLLHTLISTFKQQYNEAMKSLQFHKSVQWMDFI